MSVFDGRRHWLLFGALLISTLLTVAIGGIGAGLGLIALLDAGLLAALRVVLPYAVATGVLSLLNGVLFVATVIAALRRLSLPRDDRLARLAARAERTLPGLRSLGLAERFEPTPAERRERLKRRYVEGDMSEAEFEHRVREHVDDPGAVTDDPLLSQALADDADPAAEDGRRERERQRRERSVDLE